MAKLFTRAREIGCGIYSIDASTFGAIDEHDFCTSLENISAANITVEIVGGNGLVSTHVLIAGMHNPCTACWKEMIASTAVSITETGGTATPLVETYTPSGTNKIKIITINLDKPATLSVSGGGGVKILGLAKNTLEILTGVVTRIAISSKAATDVVLTFTGIAGANPTTSSTVTGIKTTAPSAATINVVY